METILSARIKQKIDTSQNWATNNPILLEGEFGIESDTNKMKIGNGTDKWNDLDYCSSIDFASLEDAIDGTNEDKVMSPLTTNGLLESDVFPLQDDTLELINEFLDKYEGEKSGPIEIASREEAIEGTDNTKAMSPLRVREVIDLIDKEVEENTVRLSGVRTRVDDIEANKIPIITQIENSVATLRATLEDLNKRTEFLNGEYVSTGIAYDEDDVLDLVKRLAEKSEFVSVQLSSDLTLTNTLDFSSLTDKTIRINLNGRNIVGNGTSAIFKLKSNRCKFIIEDLVGGGRISNGKSKEGSIVDGVGCEVVINNGIFENNDGVLFYGCLLTINNGIFIKNTSSTGSIYITATSGVNANDKYANIKGGYFLSNTAKTHLFSANKGTISINGGTFKENSTEEGIFGSVKDLSINEATFINNQYKGSSTKGIIVTANSTPNVYISNSTFKNDKYQNSAKLFYSNTSDTKTINFTNVEIEDFNYNNLQECTVGYTSANIKADVTTSFTKIQQKK